MPEGLASLEDRRHRFKPPVSAPDAAGGSGDAASALAQVRALQANAAVVALAVPQRQCVGHRFGVRLSLLTDTQRRRQVQNSADQSALAEESFLPGVRGAHSSNSFRRVGRLYFQGTACRHPCGVISGTISRQASCGCPVGSWPCSCRPSQRTTLSRSSDASPGLWLQDRLAPETQAHGIDARA